MNDGSCTRPVLAYAPLCLLAIATIASWTSFLHGGFTSIVGWLALSLPLPLLALVILVGTIARTIWKRRRWRRLAATAILAALGLWPAAWQVGLGAIAFPYDLAKTRPTATVRLPTDAPMRVLWGGDDYAHNRHAAMPDQRWAYDLAVEPVLVGSTRLEDYGCYGVAVVAPIAGVVRVAHDGEDDHVPGAASNDFRAPLGNHVAIELPSGGFLLLAHLKKGSVVAHEGARVAEGAPLGACGNSGNTSEPHVHIHAQRQDPRGRAVNFSEGLPLFFRDHEGAPMPLGGIAVSGGKVIATGAVVRHSPPMEAATSR